MAPQEVGITSGGHDGQVCSPENPAERLPALLGRRVALRHRLPADQVEPGGPTLTDAVGELADAGPDAVLVHTRRGVVRVARDAVVAVREIPPPLPKRPSWAAVDRLERICADAWPPVESRPLGQWRLRAAGGFTGRANSALAVGEPGMPVARALDEVAAFYTSRGLPVKVQVAAGSPEERAISGCGWRVDEDHPAGARVIVLVGDLGPGAPPPGGAAPGDVRLTVAAEPDPDWWTLAGNPPVTEAQRHVLAGVGVPSVGFALARDAAGTAIGAARLAVLDRHLHVARLAVPAEHRRRGLATALMGLAARWGAQRGARWCVLQVAEHNAPALALYERLGFRPHHHYVYLAPPRPGRSGGE